MVVNQLRRLQNVPQYRDNPNAEIQNEFLSAMDKQDLLMILKISLQT